MYVFILHLFHLDIVQGEETLHPPLSIHSAQPHYFTTAQNRALGSLFTPARSAIRESKLAVLFSFQSTEGPHSSFLASHVRETHEANAPSRLLLPMPPEVTPRHGGWRASSSPAASRIRWSPEQDIPAHLHWKLPPPFNALGSRQLAMPREN